MKQTIRLTESELRGMIKEAVNENVPPYGEKSMSAYGNKPNYTNNYANSLRRHWAQQGLSGDALERKVQEILHSKANPNGNANYQYSRPNNSSAPQEYSTYGTRAARGGRQMGESKLRGMIRTAVNEALNEIGDTLGGQYMLGRAAQRARKLGDNDTENLAVASARRYWGDNDYDRHGINSFADGRNDQKDLMSTIDSPADTTYQNRINRLSNKIAKHTDALRGMTAKKMANDQRRKQRQRYTPTPTIQR